MEIDPRHPTPPVRASLTSAPALVRAWQSGQLIEATVVRLVPERKAALLQWAEGEVEAQTELPLRPGMRLKFTVEPHAEQWQLRLADATTATRETVAAALRHALPRATSLATLCETIDRVLRQPVQEIPERVHRALVQLARGYPDPEHLCRREGLEEALRNSGVLLESHLAATSSPPATDRKAQLLALLHALTAPRSDTASPGTERTPLPASAPHAYGEPPTAPPGSGQARPPQPANAMPLSGETPPPPKATLPADPDPIPSPFPNPRTGLSLLPPAAVEASQRINDEYLPEQTTGAKHHPAPPARSVGETPPPAGEPEFIQELLRHAEGALSRIQLHQLRALPDSPQEPLWSFELPVRMAHGTETLLLRFERGAEHECRSSVSGADWRVTLDLSDAEHGALRAVLNWNGKQINTHFFAERPATTELFRRHLSFLAARLTSAGIAIGTFDAHTGIPAHAAPDAPSGILSVRA